MRYLFFARYLPKNEQQDFQFLPSNDYGFYCLNYIHQNPVKANMVIKAIDYKWSSAMDYAGLRDGDLCNLEMGRQLKNFR